MGQALHDILEAAGEAAEPAAWMEALARWVLAFPARGEGGACPRTQALYALTEALEAHPGAEALRERIRGFWSHASAVRLLAEVGVAEHPTFVREAFQRLADRILPRVDPADDLYAFVDRLQPDASDALWLRRLPPDLLAIWQDLLQPDPDSRPEAIRLLAHRAAALGLSRDVLRLFPGRRDLESPFAGLLGAVKEDGAGEAAVVACLGELEAARLRLEARGVSTDLVYRLDLLEAHLLRIRDLLALGRGEREALDLTVQLLEGASAQHRIRPLLHHTLRRLARKIVEHSGETGEHYLARTREAFWSMGASAAGGGALTAFTALGKVLLAGLPFAPGPLGLLLSLNYAGSFAAMQFLHFSLASKQPAATAAALAGALDGPRDHETEVDMVAAITRGQVAATLGNLLVAMPVALLVDLGWRLVTGHPLLSEAKAAATVASLHPLRSWTLPFAAFTGVILWLGSLAGGWAYNWSAHRDLAESVGRSLRIQALLGRARAESLGRGLGRHLPGLVACAALGLMLGLLPLFLAFGGLPLDVRHVTLSAASLAMALGRNLSTGTLPWAGFVWGLAGVACIGALNFGVSFLFSLRLALRARDLGELDRKALSRALWSAFRRNPRRFLWPRKGDA